jgi:hypothetical protein
MTASMRSRRTRRSLGAMAIVASAMLFGACGDDGGTTTTTSNPGTGGSNAGTGGGGGSGGSTTGGDDGGSTGGTGPIGTGGSGGTDPHPARCKTSIVWALLERVESIPNDHLARLGGISPDELTAAWTSGGGDVYVADRATYKDAFGVPVKVNAAALASDRVAVAPTGNSRFFHRLRASIARRSLGRIERARVHPGEGGLRSWRARLGARLERRQALVLLSRDAAGTTRTPPRSGLGLGPAIVGFAVARAECRARAGGGGQTTTSDGHVRRRANALLLRRGDQRRASCLARCAVDAVSTFRRHWRLR